MKVIEGINIHNLEVVVKGKNLKRHDIYLGGLTLSVDGREFILDVVQSYSDEIDEEIFDEDVTIRITCEIESDEETFDECPYDLTKDDLLDCEHNDLVRTLFVDGDSTEFDVESIILHFDDCEGQDYQIKINEEN